VLLGGLRVKALRETPNWKKLLALPAFDASMARLAEETSFDPRKVLYELMYSWDGTDSLVYARGEFAPMGLEPRIEKEGVRRMNYKGSMLIGDAEYAVVFFNSSTGVAGRTARLHQLIDDRDTQRGGASELLRDRLRRLPYQTHAWMVADGAALANSSGSADSVAAPLAQNLLQNMPKLLEAVQGVSLQADLTDGVALRLWADCNDSAGAKQVHDAARGILGLLRFTLQGPKNEPLRRVFEAVQVEQKEAQTSLTARLTPEQFVELEQALRARRG
jgi:hypothetical protein